MLSFIVKLNNSGNDNDGDDDDKSVILDTCQMPRRAIISGLIRME
jgi:hypothetical protein